ncbi:MAG: SpoIIE family protein phosphatase [Salinivirgaceae bacterium]|nr:SpoIIE family protein phosphatase [Salinivirgaceae bacterium]
MKENLRASGHTLKKFIPFLFLMSLFFCFTIDSSKAQRKQLPEEVKTQIENYKVNAIKNRNLGDDNAAASYLNKIAYLYWEYFIYDEAIKNFEEVMTINQDLGNKMGEQKVLDNLAFVYNDMDRFDKAIECFLKSLVLIKTRGEKQPEAECLSNLAVAYTSNAQYSEAIQAANQGLEISKSLNHLKLMRSFYGTLHECYEKKGDKDKSMEYFGLYSSIDKHLQQQLFEEQQLQSQARITQIEAEKNRTERVLEKTKDTLKEVEQITREKQLEINLLNSQKELQELAIKQHEVKSKAERRLRYFLISIFIFVCLITLLIYNQMREKKLANAKLQELYSEIEKKNIQILDSINYASHIQEAILPYEKHMNDDIPSSFVFYKPRDIVSGDFYWHSNHGNKVFVAAIDCTGHGVPGAFMSMIGNTLLNEIVNENQIFNPAEVLSQLNEKVVFTLNQDQKDKESFSEDGMDITFCCYDKVENTLELALANHTACLIQDHKTTLIEGDIFSIGGNVGFGQVLFKLHKFKITATTTLYMYSDGFQDQFGGDHNQKYMAPRFIEFLEKIQSIPFEQHKQLLEQEYEVWKGESRQIDDVLVIGARFIA